MCVCSKGENSKIGSEDISSAGSSVTGAISNLYNNEVLEEITPRNVVLDPNCFSGGTLSYTGLSLLTNKSHTRIIIRGYMAVSDVTFIGTFGRNFRILIGLPFNFTSTGPAARDYYAGRILNGASWGSVTDCDWSSLEKHPNYNNMLILTKVYFSKTAVDGVLILQIPHAELTA